VLGLLRNQPIAEVLLTMIYMDHPDKIVIVSIHRQAALRFGVLATPVVSACNANEKKA
jgi:hypothetical protein